MHTTRYSRGFFKAEFVVKLVCVVAVGFVVLSWLLDRGGGQAPSSAPPVPPTAWDPSGLQLCKVQPQPATKQEYAFPSDTYYRRARCWLLPWMCDVRWSAYDVNLCTQKGLVIAASQYDDYSLRIRGFEPTDGKTVYSVANPVFNCHGYSFAGSAYWVKDAEPLLCTSGAACANALYRRVADPQLRDIAVYRDGNGVAVHSGILVRIDNVTIGGRTVPLRIIRYKNGWGPTVEEKVEGPGKDTAWADPAATLQYYRRI